MRPWLKWERKTGSQAAIQTDLKLLGLSCPPASVPSVTVGMNYCTWLRITLVTMTTIKERDTRTSTVQHTIETQLDLCTPVLTCINILVVAKRPMLEFGRTCRASVQRRLMKARARWWETCFLRLVSMTSRQWSTISIPSLVAPKTDILQSQCHYAFIMQPSELQKTRKMNHYYPAANHPPSQ